MAHVVIRDPRCRGAPLKGDGHKALGADAICIFNTVVMSESLRFSGDQLKS